MDHRAFPKIPTSLADTPGAGASWVATEKIHGAQLVLGTDGAQVRFGKRKAWLDERESFFGWQLLRNELSVAALAVFAALPELGLAARQLYIYGELFGGAYPHPEVPALPGISAVQTGIHYGPALYFCAFDLLIVAPHGERGEGERGELEQAELFLAHAQLEELGARAGLSVVPLLGRGTRRELTALPVRYASRVPERLGLPALPHNLAEGYVLKPDRALPPRGRPLVKHKIPEFDDARFDASAPFDANAHLAVDELLRWAVTMVNPMRIASARSKVGEAPEAVSEEALLDVWIDLEAIFPRRMLALSEDEEETLRAELVARIAQALSPARQSPKP